MMTRYKLFLLLICGLFFTCSIIRKERTFISRFPGIFTSVPANQATGFTLKNRDKLSIPVDGKSYHQQGVQRLEDGGWVVSGSGQEEGYLYFSAPDGIIQTVLTIPDDLRISGSPSALKYNHPGGFQIAGQILAVGLENTDYRSDSYSRVILLDVSDPKGPRHLSHLDIVRDAEPDRVMTAGDVAIAGLSDSYLLIVGNWSSRRLDFYQTSSKDLSDLNTTMSDCLGSLDFGPDGKPYQNINVYGNSADNLFLIGLYSRDRREDLADLFALDVSDEKNIRVKKIAEKLFSGGVEGPHFVHGGGTFFDFSTGRLLFFSVEAHRHEEEVFCNLWGDVQQSK